MKLYRNKVPAIAADCIGRLADEGDIDLAPNGRTEAEADMVAIMEDFLKRDMGLRDDIRDQMSRRAIPYDQYGKTRSALAEERAHPLGDDVDRFLARQMVEALMITRWVEEVYSEDKVIYKKLLQVLKSHDVDEGALREEAAGKIKNVREGTVEYEIAFEAALRDVKKRRGLI